MWQHGFGYSDVENKLLAGTGCIMRIASISKSLTAAACLRLWQEGRLDLDAPVSKYVDKKDWPDKVSAFTTLQMNNNTIHFFLTRLKFFKITEQNKM